VLVSFFGIIEYDFFETWSFEMIVVTEHSATPVLNLLRLLGCNAGTVA
jgi:hypothetical protein